MAVLRPRRIVADHIVVLSEHSVRVNLVQSRFPARKSSNEQGGQLCAEIICYLLEDAARDGLDALFDGVDATIQPVQTLIRDAELSHADQRQFEELFLISRNV